MDKKKLYIKNLEKNRYMCMYNRITLLYTWNQHNIVNQLYANLKNNRVGHPPMPSVPSIEY